MIPARWRGAAVGGVVWVVWAVALRPDWTAVLLVLSPLVLVTLGLGLAARPEAGPESPAPAAMARWAPVLAVSTGASFLVGAGPVALALSLPWLGFTVAVALIGLARLGSRPSVAVPGIGIDAGMIFLAVGGAWLTISRAGANPMGFDDAIVQLTAVHFHYAGFALPIVAGFVADRLSASAFIPAAVIVGVPLTALGITVGGLLEWVGATAMALAGLATAALVLRLAVAERGLGRGCLGLAGLALGSGMGLALGWAWSMRFGWSYLGLDQMAALHGSLNALGFGFLGLAGLTLLPVTMRPAETMPAEEGPAKHTTTDHGPITLFLGRPSPAALDRLLESAHRHHPTNPPGLLARPVPPGFRRGEWQRTTEPHPGTTSDLSAFDAVPFDAVRTALDQWAGHRVAGVALRPDGALLEVGQTVVLAIMVGPIGIGAGCRIVEVIDEPDRYGFVYATLGPHPLSGEESFAARRLPDGRVVVTIISVWQPASTLARVCPPLTRILQHRRIERYLTGLTASPG